MGITKKVHKKVHNKKHRSHDIVPTDHSAYDPATTPMIIRELFDNAKRFNLLEGEEFKKCQELAFKQRYAKSMRDFWTSLGKHMKDKKEFSRDTFMPYIEVIDDTLLSNGKTVECKDSFVKNLLPESDFKNINKQRSLQDILFPYFGTNTKVVGKNFITAFTGVHRDTENSPSGELIPRLNKKAK